VNLVERWFKEPTHKRLRRGVFTSFADLAPAIVVRAQHWNDDPNPSSGRPPPTTSPPRSGVAVVILLLA
jgi:hypothetical protein